MDELENKDPGLGNGTSTSEVSPKPKSKPRGKKRKRIESESASESDEGLPENAFEVEKNVIASAVKNNLDDVSVKKILKKVVTNDHVLALVKLREEEESITEESKLVPKLTRAKVKELTKVSPTSAPWNLQNLELTPIKHIPVKTRPEVTALIAQELPEDEDDEEYEPTHDDVPSDDDQGMESCSDLDSQPRTPATPKGQSKLSPKVVKDGPFKVPQELSTPTRRRLDLDEEATIALRTRSKLCLSETPIEHIESSFVPPDELPVPVVDDHLWNEFLNECLNPASVSKHEDDDETDPEYNVAADPDAPDDDDEDALERSIIKISKKELNDLVNELFNIMPEDAVDGELTKVANGSVAGTTNNQTTSHWEGKQEPTTSEDEVSVKMVDRIVFERRSSTGIMSVGKTEPDDAPAADRPPGAGDTPGPDGTVDVVLSGAPQHVIEIEIQEECASDDAPPSVRTFQSASTLHRVEVTLDGGTVILPEQIQILQQQLRQHIQLSASNFLQLFVHPIHWSFGPKYREYLESFAQMAESNPNSVVNVCNLKPALELCGSWAKSVSQDTPENKKMVEFIQEQSARCARRMMNNYFYCGEFHETLMRTVANSPVFLYPSLLPAMPYRADRNRRFGYQRSEDALIALGLDQFWDYVENNPGLYKRPGCQNRRYRWGLGHTVSLVIEHMLPWISHKMLMSHICNVRRVNDKDNPIIKFMTNREIVAVRHKLLPYNPALTLYEQPEHEMPRIWVRYLAKTSRRFKMFLNQRRSIRATLVGEAPAGVEVTTGVPLEPPLKKPLPIDFTKKITSNRLGVKHPKTKQDKFDIEIQNAPVEPTPNFYKLVETSMGINLVPLTLQPIVVPPDMPVKSTDTNTVDCNVTPISSAIEVKKDLRVPTEKVSKEPENPSHCKCCVLLRSICKRQKVITDYFRSNKGRIEVCPCRQKRSPRISNRLRLLVNRYKSRQEVVWNGLINKINDRGSESEGTSQDRSSDSDRRNAEDLAYAIEYQAKLTLRSILAQNIFIKKRIHTLFSKFDLDIDNPLALYERLEKVFDVEMVDLYKEFIGFLTAEQAETVGKFREYFVLNCMEGLVEKVEEHVRDKLAKREILMELCSMFSGSRAACDACAALLARMRNHPALAEYAFPLFPHAINIASEQPRSPERASSSTVQRQTREEEQADETLTNGGKAVPAPDYEADHSSSGEESETGSVRAAPTQTEPHAEKMVSDVDMEPALNKTSGHDQPTPSTTKPTPTDTSDDDSSDMSMMIMSEDETIKTEPQEWKREEDKLILEHVLKINLQPDKHRTVMDILEEKDVVEELTQALPNKSNTDVKERIMYLLNVLLESGK